MVSSGGSNLGTATLQLRAGDRSLKKDLANAEAMTKKRLERFSRKAQAAGHASRWCWRCPHGPAGP